MNARETETRGRRPRTHLAIAALLAIGVMAIACANLVAETSIRTYPLDLDGWGHLVSRLSASREIGALFREPSLWKGPVIPFLFGLAYYVVPYPESPLALNVAYISWGEDALWSRLGYRPPK